MQNIKDYSVKPKLYKVAIVLLAPFYRIFYFLKIKNRNLLPEKSNYIICANHSCFKDPIFLAIANKTPIRFMAKNALFENRFLDWLLSSLGAFPLTKNNESSYALSNSKKLLQQGEVLGIFIEGTRSKTGKLLKPKTGVAYIAYNTQVPIVPVSISTKNGKVPKIFRRVTVNIGKSITAKDLGIKEGSALEIRRASRYIMQQIALLREQDLKKRDDAKCL